MCLLGTPPPLQSPPLVRDSLPGGEGRQSPSDGPPPEFWYNLKKISSARLAPRIS